MLVKKMCDIAALEKLLDSDNLSYDEVSRILDLPKNTGGGYGNSNPFSAFCLSAFRYGGSYSDAADKLYNNLQSECLADLFLKDPESIDKLNISGIENDLEYISMKNIMINEQKAIDLINAMLQLSPKYDNAIINVMQFAVIYGNENIISHILDSSPEFEPDILCSFVRFLVEFSRFDIIKRLVDENDEERIDEIMEPGFWNDTSNSSRISNAEAACRYLEEMLTKLYDKNRIKEKINEKINSPYNMRHFILKDKDLNDLSNHGITITDATLIVPAVWSELKNDCNQELFKRILEPMLADKLTFSLSELVDYCSERMSNERLNVSGIIIKTIELVGAERLTVNLSDIYDESGLPSDDDYAENTIISSITANAVKALLKIPNYCIDEDDTEFHLLEKLTIYIPRLIIGLVKEKAITGKALEAVLNIAINNKNYELLNHIRLALPTA